jgi:hypothetical protein
MFMFISQASMTVGPPLYLPLELFSSEVPDLFACSRVLCPQSPCPGTPMMESLNEQSSLYTLMGGVSCLELGHGSFMPGLGLSGWFRGLCVGGGGWVRG